ncbi:hypothetical protein BCR32DRAFT_243278 [Anaeromyces robustus]|uniref:Histone H1 n=1 Tax=Anaeromyces robustus TaxID=1754192 RepID=A0A1Y1XCS3_9FUNG|nr:hypothetical protein BCR32DRAFT_243278 [Anaeromyces robustus]|eukprot:ORX83591.1 hypothetical protein BCR32DRAFT_243278 [Anaeromyces robustus]
MSAAKVAVSRKAEHPTYKEMISAAIINLKERNGSSRQAIKKYIHANYKVNDNADALIRNTIKNCVEKGIFIQPKGTSGPLKLAKKPVEKKEKKVEVKKEKKVEKKTEKKVEKKNAKAKVKVEKKKAAPTKKDAATKKTTKAATTTKKAAAPKTSTMKAKVAAKRKCGCRKSKE